MILIGHQYDLQPVQSRHIKRQVTVHKVLTTIFLLISLYTKLNDETDYDHSQRC